ncbi:hypothetical protein C8F04DRAFT_1262232 [Mycena alexandri]|uniref:Uncharacterized protein n=1 Tax=Mycena alexandri TaxID=1745969 RepID=A0AAD6X261_9AGAR|nr:hypothetical protein C8F04DRAFT_1262232 [Mycena alexandri]
MHFLPIPPPRSHDEFPLVQFWYRKDFKDTDLATFGDNDKHQKLGFLEHEDGRQYTKEEIKAQRKHTSTAFQTLLLRGLAPPTWSQASSVAVNWFRAEMLTHCPDLALCAANWKVDVLATEVYSQWSRRRDVEIQERLEDEAMKKKTEQGKKAQKRKAVEDDSEEDADLPPSKSKKQRSEPKLDKVKSRSEKRRKKKKATANSSDVSSVLSSNSRNTTHPPSLPASQPPSRAATLSPAPAADIDPSELANATPYNRYHQRHHQAQILLRRLVYSGIFGKSAPKAQRLNPPQQQDASTSAITTAAAGQTEATQHSSDSTAATSSSDNAPRKSKSKPHKPGAAHTAWNMFARKHMKKNHKHTTAEVRAVFSAMSPPELQTWKVKAATKQIQKGGNASEESDSEGEGEATQSATA